eukprot:774488-Prorocentrum_minimum.AAC.1
MTTSGILYQTEASSPRGLTQFSFSSLPPCPGSDTCTLRPIEERHVHIPTNRGVTRGRAVLSVVTGQVWRAAERGIIFYSDSAAAADLFRLRSPSLPIKSRIMRGPRYGP